jgi:hypothetical protein
MPEMKNQQKKPARGAGKIGRSKMEGLQNPSKPKQKPKSTAKKRRFRKNNFGCVESVEI